MFAKLMGDKPYKGHNGEMISLKVNSKQREAELKDGERGRIGREEGAGV